MRTDEVIEALRAGLAYLEREGFTLIEAKRIESKLGDFYSITYRSEAKRREVGVAYFPERNSANASIRDIERPFNWKDAGAMYLDKPKLEEAPGEGMPKLSAYLGSLKDVLLRDFGGVLNGAAFENSPYDWSPYK